MIPGCAGGICGGVGPPPDIGLDTCSGAPKGDGWGDIYPEGKQWYVNYSTYATCSYNKACSVTILKQQVIFYYLVLNAVDQAKSLL